MILFYSEKQSARLRYTAKLLLSDLLGLQVRFTSDKEEFLKCTTPKINYSKDRLRSGIFIQSAPLLFETDIFEQNFKSGKTESGLPIFFMSSKKSHLPFDPFAASFYLVTRYEEYIPFLADEHNRFPAEQSLAYRLKALKRPLVNEYAFIIKNLILEHYPRARFSLPKYRFTNSVDIDNASAFLGKGLIRMAGGYLRDLFTLKFSDSVLRTQSIFLGKRDPFETFDWQLKLQEKYGYSSVYFALFTKLGPYDRNLNHQSTRLQSYIKGINDFCRVGIHPSYQSNYSLRKIEEEKVNLENLIKTEVTQSRQHFLRLSFPETYRNLLQLEISDDYTMGFASQTGFRAGICTPFRFYDLEQEIETPLTIHPFPFMDGTYIYYTQQGPEEALSEILEYIKIYRKYGGEFIPVFHNRIFSEKEPEWKGWCNVFEQMVKAAV